MTGEGTLEQVLAGEATWCVVQGDCLEILPTLPERCIDVVHTDPPYSAHTHSKSRAGARKTPLLDGNGKLSRCAFSREVDFGFDPISVVEMERLGVEWERLCKRWVLVFSDVESTHLWRGALTSAGLEYCRTGAWIKVGGTPQFTGDRPGVGFEAVTICHRKGRKRWNGGGSLAVWSHLTCIERGGQSVDNNLRVHPTQKPGTLAIELTRLFSEPGELILDTHLGSGTHGVAALRLGRRFIGIEKEQKWAEVSRERLRAEESGSTLAARRAGQATLFGWK
jgi:site-specific DNA-methyltransferase (adenine-specific)